jgi:hypothetical protein
VPFDVGHRFTNGGHQVLGHIFRQDASQRSVVPISRIGFSRIPPGKPPPTRDNPHALMTDNSHRMH